MPCAHPHREPARKEAECSLSWAVGSLEWHPGIGVALSSLKGGTAQVMAEDIGDALVTQHGKSD